MLVGFLVHQGHSGAGIQNPDIFTKKKDGGPYELSFHGNRSWFVFRVRSRLEYYVRIVFDRFASMVVATDDFWRESMTFHWVCTTK